MFALKFLGKFRDFGLLLMRVGLGAAYVIHGSSKMFGGPQKWSELGGSMQHLGLGVDLGPLTIWGFLAAFAEFAGGILLILGFLFRPAALLLLFTMVVATVMLFKTGQDYNTFSHPLKMALVFLGLLFVGAGRYSIDKE
jgi:putative oxidoreductase